MSTAQVLDNFHVRKGLPERRLGIPLQFFFSLLQKDNDNFLP